MAVDPYARCPCGSGKKLKFCCSDLAPEIDKVQRMLEGDQPRAALAHLDGLLAKTPGRASLLELKSAIALATGDHASAAAAAAEYLRVDPQNPQAHAQAALAAAAEAYDPEGPDGDDDDTPAPAAPALRAAQHLQDALELVGDTIPDRLLQAIGATGQALLAAGDLVAARAHLWLYQGIAGREDTRAMALLTRLNQSGSLPLLLRDNQFLREAPAGHPCEAQHDHAQLLASRGQWRRALVGFDALCREHPDLPMLPFNAAVVAGWLGDSTAFLRGMRQFARLTAAASAGDIPDDAIEAEALAQLLDVETGESRTEVFRTAFAVADEEALLDRLTRDTRTVAYQLSEAERRAMSGPRPRQTRLLLDRPLPSTGEGITLEATPRIVGVLSYFGRQTDRAERLELVADRDAAHAATLALLADVTGTSLGAVTEEVSVGYSSVSEPALAARWQFPDDTGVSDRRRVIGEGRREAVVTRWVDTPRVALGGKSPRAAASDPALALPLRAAVLVLEQHVRDAVHPSAFREVRALVGLPEPAEIDPNTIEAETLPLVRVTRVRLADASDDALYMLYKRAELAGANDAILLVAREVAERPGLAEDLPAELVYARLASLEPEFDAAVAWLDRGRAIHPEASCAAWDLVELEINVLEGRFDGADRLVRHLSERHLNEPGVAERLYEMLQALGVVPPPGQAPRGGEAPLPAVPSAPAGAAAAPSKIWTPESAAPAGGQKLWTPD